MLEDPRDDQLPFLGALGDQLKPAFRRREAEDIGRALKRRRLMLLVPVLALLAAGGAVAAVAVLKGRPSAPLSGAVAPSPSDSFPGSGTTRYSLVVTPSLGAGTVGWCINEQLQIPVPVPVGDVSGLRALLLKLRLRAREERSSALANLAGRPGELYGPTGRPLLQTLPDTTAEERHLSRVELARVDRELAKFPPLLRELREPQVRASQAFQQEIRDIAGAGFQYTQPGTNCSHVERTGNPFIGSPYVGFVGGSYNILSDKQSPSTRRLTTTTVYLTAPDVAAVRASPGLTILTRAIKALPDGYRIAITVSATQQKLKPGQKPLNNYRIYTAGQAINPFFGTLPSMRGASRPIALDAAGRASRHAPTRRQRQRSRNLAAAVPCGAGGSGRDPRRRLRDPPFGGTRERPRQRSRRPESAWIPRTCWPPAPVVRLRDLVRRERQPRSSSHPARRASPRFTTANAAGRNTRPGPSRVHQRAGHAVTPLNGHHGASHRERVARTGSARPSRPADSDPRQVGRMRSRHRRTVYRRHRDVHLGAVTTRCHRHCG